MLLACLNSLYSKKRKNQHKRFSQKTGSFSLEVWSEFNKMALVSDNVVNFYGLQFVNGDIVVKSLVNYLQC